MKKFTTLSIFLILPLFAQANPITIKVKGMVCAFCAQGIEKKFKALPETAKIHVSLETKKVDLDLKEGKDISDEQIKKIITEAGYDVQGIERTK